MNEQHEIDIDKEIAMGLLYDNMNGLDYLIQQYGEADEQEGQEEQEE